MNRKTRILICDDEPHILHVVGLNLRQAGYGVILAATAEQALKGAAEHDPVLCVVDYLLPDIDGYELCRRLRQLPGKQSMPIIMLTAMDYRLPLSSDALAAPSAVMGKPFSPRAVVEQVQGLLAPLTTTEAP